MLVLRHVGAVLENVRAAGVAVGKRGGGRLDVDAGGLRGGKAFRETDDLHDAEQVVDELEGGAGADRAEVVDLAADRRDVGRYRFQIRLVVGAAEDDELAGRRRVGPPGDRAVDIAQPLLLGGAGQLLHPVGRHRRVLDDERALGQAARQSAVRPHPHRPRGGVVGDGAEDDVGALDRLARARGRLRALVNERLQLLDGAVVDGEVMAGSEQARAHRLGHVAAAEIGDLRHVRHSQPTEKDETNGTGRSRDHFTSARPSSARP